METGGLIWTDSGMCAMWRPDPFRGIVDYESWADVLGTDDLIAGHIATGALVPLNLGFDTTFQVLARVGTGPAPADLTERERAYLVIASEPYLFVSSGEAMLSGIEHIGPDPGQEEAVRLRLPAGRWGVRVHLIDWEAEPGSRDEEGNPAPGCLPDVVLTIDPERDPPEAYRTKLPTYDRP